MEIGETVRAHLRDIGHDGRTDVAYENAQARERTQVLMDMANMENGLVIGTGDLSELALGWATYNGDHMSMYGVNAGVPKTLVRYLVEYEAGRCGGRAWEALRDILDTPVSPELLPPKMVKFHRKPSRSSGRMNCTTFSCTICCALEHRRRRSCAWRILPLPGGLCMRRFGNG